MDYFPEAKSIIATIKIFRTALSPETNEQLEEVGRIRVSVKTNK
jgi:hypothetical protein